MQNPERHREWMRERYDKYRAHGIKALGGKCASCGADNHDDLHFDHIDPSTKSFEVADKTNLSLGKWVAEVAKCQLLCSGCHKKKHGSKAEHGTARRYWTGCRCQPCRSAASYHGAVYKAATRSTAASARSL